MNPALPDICLKLRRFLAFCLVLVVAGCTTDQTLEALDPDDTILAFGDSLTFGKGASWDNAYPAVLAELSGLRVINAGVSGETTARGLSRLPDQLEEHQPELVILFEGGNDVLRNLSVAETKQNLDAMIRRIQDYGAQVVLVAVPEKSLFSSAAPWYPELAEEHGIPLEKAIVSKLLKKPALKSDGVHFNAAGYRKMAEAIHELLTDSGAY